MALWFHPLVEGECLARFHIPAPSLEYAQSRIAGFASDDPGIEKSRHTFYIYMYQCYPINLRWPYEEAMES